jgi:mono/diheme cytochrome c family protein
MHAKARGLKTAAAGTARIRSAAFLLGVASVVLCGRLDGAPVDFVHQVRPIFEKHCYSCHGAEKQKSGLRLDVKAAALKGGEEHAPNIVPGNPKQSFLFATVTRS